MISHDVCKTQLVACMLMILKYMHLLLVSLLYSQVAFSNKMTTPFRNDKSNVHRITLYNLKNKVSNEKVMINDKPVTR